MDFDGRELTRYYLESVDLSVLLKEVQSFTTAEELEAYMLKHGENIVDKMGGEIDRIEMKLRVSSLLCNKKKLLLIFSHLFAEKIPRSATL